MNPMKHDPEALKAELGDSCRGYRCPHEISGDHWVLIPEDIQSLLKSQASQYENRMKEVVEKIERYEEIFAWLQGEKYDFPPKQENDPPYYWRKALRIKLEQALLQSNPE